MTDCTVTTNPPATNRVFSGSFDVPITFRNHELLTARQPGYHQPIHEITLTSLHATKEAFFGMA